MIYKTYKVLYDFKEKMNEKNISSYAASTAFFLFVSMIPIFALICTVISFTSLSEEDFVFLIMEMSPGVVGSFFASLIEDIYAQSAGAISIAIVVTIWSAGKGMMALMRGLNVINGVQENRGYFITRGISGIYTVIMILSVSITMLFMGFGKEIFGLFMKSFPSAEHIFEKISYFRFLFFFALIGFFNLFVCGFPWDFRLFGFFCIDPVRVFRGIFGVFTVVFLFFLQPSVSLPCSYLGNIFVRHHSALFVIVYAFFLPFCNSKP